MKIVIGIGAALLITGIFISSYVTNIWLFIFFYGCFLGIGNGIIYMQPTVCAWEYFPDRKGLITGVMSSAYGMSTFIFSQMSTRIINPNDEEAVIIINENLKFFSEDVASRVPYCLRLMCLIFSIMVLIGCLLISRPKAEEEEDDDQGALTSRSTENSMIDVGSGSPLLN